MNVELSDSVPFAEWPGVQGLEGYDEGNYIVVLFLAWAYILSARWSELLCRSPEHRCMITSKKVTPRCEAPLPQSSIEVDIGDDAADDEVRWWEAVLSASEGWSMTTVYNGRTYVSPWALAISGATELRTKQSSNAEIRPPSPHRAVGYLARFCCYKRLYGQCSAALSAALCIHFVWTNCDVKGIRSLLHTAFFNPDIECNLVVTWMSAAFAVIDPVTQEGGIVKLLEIFARRLPKLAPLWLGAILADNVKALGLIMNRCVAVELHAAAWTDTIGSFITLTSGLSDGKVIRREDECPLLHIIGCGSYARLPVWPWKPFGETLLNDSELEAQKHAQCNCHCLEYQAWYWELADGKDLEAHGADAHQPGIFGWLRPTGYLENERHVYKHPWFDVIDSNEDEILDNQEDGSRVNEADRRKPVENWLDRNPS
ncbi:hypothetical protein BDV40DRAFT_293411 [Aspergillus tamarii]|uniref:Uncharacterized protein n=1 Tax=Aspergillus tamarii TaxID=41984 RepID=A0A5N6UDA8_ASPTM|nr:hypothetical protein BDV40DRAFT_293411 [Aspergillus tamarii]